MPRTRPQPPAPESWNDPSPPISTPQNAGEYTPLQRELCSEIEDVQRLLKHVLNRVDINAPIGITLIMKLTQVIFLIGKYQHSQELRAAIKTEKQPAMIRPSEIDQLIKQREAAGNYAEITPQELAAAAEKIRADESLKQQTQTDARGYVSSGYQVQSYPPPPSPPADYNYNKLGYDAAVKLPPEKFNIWQRLRGQAINTEETEH